MIGTQWCSKVGSTVWLLLPDNNGSRRHRSPLLKTVSSAHLITAFIILACSLLQHRQHQFPSSNSSITNQPPRPRARCARKQRVPSAVSLPSYLSCNAFATSPALPLSHSMTNLYLLCTHRQAIMVGMRKRNTTLPLMILASGRWTSNY